MFPSVPNRKSLKRLEKHDRSEQDSDPGSTPDASGTGADLSRFAHRLRCCAESLKTICKQAEPDFLRLGDSLQSLHADAAELNRKVMDALNGCGTDPDGRLLPKAVEHARASLSELEADRKQMIDHLSAAEKIVEELLKLAHAGEMLQKIARSLKVIAINIGIESARFDEAQELFAPLAGEIRSLSDEVKKTALIISKDTEAAILRLSEVRSEIHRRIENLAEWASEAEKTLEATLPRVEETFRITAQVFAQAGSNAGKVAKLIGDIVSSIQIHDSITQRADHISEALLKAEKCCDANRTDGDIDSAECLKAAHSIIRLQGAQLDLLIRDVESAYDTNRTSFSELREIVDKTTQMLGGIRLTGGGIGDHASSSSSESAEASFDSIQQALRRIHSLLGQGAETSTRIGTAMDRATEAADRLSGHMGTIRTTNFDIHLKALNAIAHALQLGARGRTFSVLVTEIKERAVESDRFVTFVEEIIDKIGKETQAVGNRGPGKENIDPEASSGLILEKAIIEFSSVCDVYRENAGTIPILGGALKRNITDTITHVEFIRELSSRLSVHLKDIQQLLGDLMPLSESRTISSNPEMETISHRYTMQQERSIHEAFLGKGDFSEDSPATGTHLKPVAPSHAEVPVEDSLGDNVELF